MQWAIDRLGNNYKPALSRLLSEPAWMPRIVGCEVRELRPLGHRTATGVPSTLIVPVTHRESVNRAPANPFKTTL